MTVTRKIAVLTIIMLSAHAVAAQDAGKAYHARLMLAGYMLRSAMVCGGASAKQTIQKAMRYASGGELRQFNQAFPTTAEKWMKEGAGHFNADVMQKGITGTCDEARKLAREAP